MSHLPPPAIVPELLTTQQAAELCGLAERTFWRFSRDGRAPAPIKFGDSRRAPVRFSRQTLLQWIQAGCPPVPNNGDGG